MQTKPKSKILMKRSVLNKQLFDVVRITASTGEFLEVNLTFEQASKVVESFEKR